MGASRSARAGSTRGGVTSRAAVSAVPRHNEVPPGLVLAICKQLGIDAPPNLARTTGAVLDLRDRHLIVSFDRKDEAQVAFERIVDETTTGRDTLLLVAFDEDGRVVHDCAPDERFGHPV